MKVVLESDSGADKDGALSHTAALERPDTMAEFAEILNLMTMFETTLGLAPASIWCDFIEHTVFDTIRQREKPWQLAFELLIIMLRRVEDSDGRLSLATVYDESHLQSVMDEAWRNMRHFYPICFRTLPGKGGIVDPGTQTRTAAVQWNGEFTPDASQFCPIFQQAGNPPHPANLLSPEGKCLRKHVCFQWVSNKGPRGRCLSTKHGAANCDNKFLCKECVK